MTQNQQTQRPQAQRQQQQTQNLPAAQAHQNALKTPDGRSFMPSAQHWAQIKEMGNAAFRSGMLPASIRNAEAAAIIALKAYELGIPLMEGYAQIHIINGKPCISREMQQVLVYRNIKGSRIDILETTDKIATVQGSRPGQQPMKLSFTIEDARRASLLGKDPWKQYPQAMLLNRAISALCRFYFPDALHGCSYTPEELEPAPIETTGRKIADESAPVSPVAPAQESVQDPAPATPVEPPREAQAPEVLPSEPAPVEIPSDAPAQDATDSQGSTGPVPPSQALGQADLKFLLALAKKHNWLPDTVNQYLERRWQASRLGQLTRDQFETLCMVISKRSGTEALEDLEMGGEQGVLVDEAGDPSQDSFSSFAGGGVLV